MIYIPEFFALHELVGPEFHAQNVSRGNQAFMAFDPYALMTLDALRRAYGPIVVNNWRAGGQFKESGLREMGTGTGAALSQHKFGRAFDCKFSRTTAAQVRADMRAAGCFSASTPRDAIPEAFKYITRIEEFDGMSWFHFDTGNWDVLKSGVRVVGKS